MTEFKPALPRLKALYICRANGAAVVIALGVGAKHVHVLTVLSSIFLGVLALAITLGGWVRSGQVNFVVDNDGIRYQNLVRKFSYSWPEITEITVKRRGATDVCPDDGVDLGAEYGDRGPDDDSSGVGSLSGGPGAPRGRCGGGGDRGGPRRRDGPAAPAVVLNRQVSAWIPEPDGDTIAVVSVASPSWPDWEHVCDLALGIFDSFGWENGVLA